MKYLVALLVLVVSFAASAVLVDAVDEKESKALANSLPYLGCGASWQEQPGTRYSAGSCTLVCNNEIDGAWILTAGHTVLWSDGLVRHFIRYNFQPSYYDGFPKGTTSYLPDKTIAALHDKIYIHSTQDIALVKLENVVKDATGNLITPIEFYTGRLVENQAVLFGGYGDTGIPSQANEEGTGYRDGFKRCARGLFYFFSAAAPSRAVMKFSRTVPLPGIIGAGDSGGFATIEDKGQLFMAGVLVTASGSGESMLTGFEFLDYYPDFFDWINETIFDNRETKSEVENWKAYQ